MHKSRCFWGLSDLCLNDRLILHQLTDTGKITTTLIEILAMHV